MFCHMALKLCIKTVNLGAQMYRLSNTSMLRAASVVLVTTLCCTGCAPGAMGALVGAPPGVTTGMASVPPEVSAVRNAPNESEAWEAAKSAKDRAAVREFLGRYPNGTYADEAKALLRSGQ